MFWLIYAVDRELVYPKQLDAIIPMWLNHVMVSDEDSIDLTLLLKQIVRAHMLQEQHFITFVLCFVSSNLLRFCVKALEYKFAIMAFFSAGIRCLQITLVCVIVVLDIF